MLQQTLQGVGGRFLELSKGGFTVVGERGRPPWKKRCVISVETEDSWTSGPKQ